MAKVEDDRAAQQHRLDRQDNLEPLHDLRPVLPKEQYIASAPVALHAAAQQVGAVQYCCAAAPVRPSLTGRP